MWVCENCFEENKNASEFCSSCNTSRGKNLNNVGTSLAKSNPEDKLKEGKRLNSEGNYHEAIEVFEDAILANYKTEQAYYGLYVAYKALGRDIEAQEALNRSRPSVYSTNSNSTTSDEDIRDFASKKTVAGIFGILLGWLGVHKFILGFTAAGITMLLISLLTCGFGAIPMGIIGIVEGIIYLSKSNKDFYQIYGVDKRSWF